VVDPLGEPGQLPPKKGGGELIQAESYAVGRVSKQSYLTYLRAAGIHLWILTIILLVLVRGVEIGKQVRFIPMTADFT